MEFSRFFSDHAFPGPNTAATYSLREINLGSDSSDEVTRRHRGSNLPTSGPSSFDEVGPRTEVTHFCCANAEPDDDNDDEDDDDEDESQRTNGGARARQHSSTRLTLTQLRGRSRRCRLLLLYATGLSAAPALSREKSSSRRGSTAGRAGDAKNAYYTAPSLARRRWRRETHGLDRRGEANAVRRRRRLVASMTASLARVHNRAGIVEVERARLGYRDVMYPYQQSEETFQWTIHRTFRHLTSEVIGRPMARLSTDMQENTWTRLRESPWRERFTQRSRRIS